MCYLDALWVVELVRLTLKKEIGGNSWSVIRAGWGSPQTRLRCKIDDVG